MDGKRIIVFWAIAAGLASGPAQATRPMVVDDASILPPRYCQLESWIQHPPGQTEYWALPACNVAGSWELAFGAGRIDPRDGPAYASAIFQAKTIFHPLEKNGWGIGLTMAHQFYEGAGVAGDLSVLVPVSLSMLDDRLLVHANLGWLRKRSGRRHDALWAVGAEWTARPRLALTLETYGTGHGPGFVQAGVRFTLIPDRLDIDAGMGQRIGRGNAGRYVTVGLTLAGPMWR